MTDAQMNFAEYSGSLRLVVVRVPEPPSSREPLRPAERTVADGIVRGLSNADIARARGTSARTVANQVAALFERTGVQSRAELVRHLLGGELSS